MNIAFEDVWAARKIVRDQGATKHQRETAFETLVCWTNGWQFTPDMRDVLEDWAIQYRRTGPILRAQKVARDQRPAPSVRRPYQGAGARLAAMMARLN